MKYFLLPILLVVSFSTVWAQVNPHKDIHQVWKDHIAAWEERDLEKILEDYSVDAIVLTNHRSYRGKAQIRDLFSQLYHIFDRANYHEIDPVVIPSQGDVIYLKWKAVIDGDLYPLGTDTFVFEQGKITSQTITSYPALPLK